MRLTLAVLTVALLATPALAQDRYASLEPLGLMHIKPTPAAPTAGLRSTAGTVAEIERKADLARVKSDAFDHRIQEQSERTTRSVCSGCLAGQTEAPRVRVAHVVAATDFDPDARQEASLLSAMAARGSATRP